MIDNETKELINEVATTTIDKALKKLRYNGRVKYYTLNSFAKTEELLYLYPSLPDDNEVKIKINNALEKIKDNDWYGVIESRYFDNMKFEEIAEIYDCKYQTVSNERNILVKRLTRELFPEDMLDELLHE